jgi:hypothetical protein
MWINRKCITKQTSGVTLNWDLEIGAMPVLGWIHGPSCGALRYPKKRDDQNSKPPNLPEKYLSYPLVNIQKAIENGHL